MIQKARREFLETNRHPFSLMIVAACVAASCSEQSPLEGQAHASAQTASPQAPSERPQDTSQLQHPGTPEGPHCRPRHHRQRNLRSRAGTTQEKQSVLAQKSPAKQRISGSVPSQLWCLRTLSRRALVRATHLLPVHGQCGSSLRRPCRTMPLAYGLRSRSRHDHLGGDRIVTALVGAHDTRMAAPAEKRWPHGSRCCLGRAPATPRPNPGCRAPDSPACRRLPERRSPLGGARQAPGSPRGEDGTLGRAPTAARIRKPQMERVENRLRESVPLL